MRYADLDTQEHFRRVVELERLVWEYADGEDVVPLPLLVIAAKRGGILIGAFDDRDRMVGFVYALPGVKHGRRTQWSHMLGVLAEYRNTGVGRQLKLAQRRKAIALGVDLVEWTFDPLQAMNAHLNFTKLGVIVQEYEEHIYGESSSPLHAATPTDRFVADWWVDAPQVVARLDGTLVEATRTTDLSRTNRTRLGDRWLLCESIDLERSEADLAVEIPIGFGEMQLADAPLARAWRQATRELFVAYLTRGYRVEDFVLDRSGGRGVYVLRAGRGPMV